MSKIYAKYVSGVYSDLWGNLHLLLLLVLTCAPNRTGGSGSARLKSAPAIAKSRQLHSILAFDFQIVITVRFFFLKKVGLKGEVFDGCSSTSFFSPAELYGEER